MTHVSDISALIEGYVDDQVAAVQSVADDFQEQLTAADATIATLQSQAATDAATIADLRAQLAGQPDPPPDPELAPASTLLIGARAKEATGTLAQAFNGADATLGPLKVTRCFEGALPSAHVPITPDGVQEIVSYKSSTAANAASFVASMRPGSLLAFHHEPEADYPSGADFVKAFTAEAEKVHAAGGTLGHIAGGYQWRKGKAGADGSFLPPVDVCDWYGFDTYRLGTDNTFNAILPLEQVDEFQRWLGFVKDRGLPLRVTEYGRGIVSASPGADAKRAAAIAADGPYLAGLGFEAFILWWTNESPGEDWKFTDQGSIDAFRSLTANQ